MLKNAILIVSFLALFGCATTKHYPGPELPKEEVASIIVGMSDNVVVTDINGKGRGIGWVDAYHLMPGHNQVSVNYNGMSGQSLRELVLSFESEPGKEYYIEAIVKGSTWTAVIKEKQSNEVVSKVVRKKGVKILGIETPL